MEDSGADEAEGRDFAYGAAGGEGVRTQEEGGYPVREEEVKEEGEEVGGVLLLGTPLGEEGIRVAFKEEDGVGALSAEALTFEDEGRTPFG